MPPVYSPRSRTAGGRTNPNKEAPRGSSVTLPDQPGRPAGTAGTVHLTTADEGARAFPERGCSPPRSGVPPGPGPAICPVAGGGWSWYGANETPLIVRRAAMPQEAIELNRESSAAGTPGRLRPVRRGTWAGHGDLLQQQGVDMDETALEQLESEHRGRCSRRSSSPRPGARRGSLGLGTLVRGLQDSVCSRFPAYAAQSVNGFGLTPRAVFETPLGDRDDAGWQHLQTVEEPGHLFRGA
jgi:hypothetical protein